MRLGDAVEVLVGRPVELISPIENFVVVSRKDSPFGEDRQYASTQRARTENVFEYATDFDETQGVISSSHDLLIGRIKRNRYRLVVLGAIDGIELVPDVLGEAKVPHFVAVFYVDFEVVIEPLVISVRVSRFE